jgi:hypothetical protein
MRTARSSDPRVERMHATEAPTRTMELPQAGALVAATLGRRRAWRILLGIETALLAVLVFLAIGGLGAAVLVTATATEGSGLLLGALAAACGTALAGWHLFERWRDSRDLPRWASQQAILVQSPTEAPDRAGAERLRSGLERAQRTLLGPSAQLAVTVGSPQLVAHTLRAAQAHLPALDHARAQLKQRLWQFTILLFFCGAAWTWSVVTSPAMWRQLLRPQAEAVPIVREVGTVVGDLHLRAEPPPYAKNAVPVRDEDGGEGRVLRGGRVTVSAEPLPGFQIAAVEFETSPGKVEIAPVYELGPRRFGWQRAVLAPLRYRYRGVDAENRPVREQAFREVRSDEDAAPRAAIRQPQGEVEVKAGQSVVLDGEVGDDIGLSLVDLVITRPATGVERRPVAVTAGETRVDVKETIDVDALQLRPGEVALVQLEAADNNPLDGNRRTGSQKVRIRMFSAERYHASNLDDLGQLVETWTQRLGDRLERDPAQHQQELAQAIKGRGELAAQEQRALETLKNVHAQLVDDVLGRQKSTVDLGEIERLLGEALGEESRVIGRLDAAATGYAAVQGLYAVQKQHALVIAAEEQAAWALGQLASTEQAGALARDGKTLADVEKQLVSTLEKLAEGGAAPLQAEAERLLDSVEQQLDRMVAEAQKQQRLVPYEHVNAGGLDATGLQRDLGDQRQALAEIRQLLKQGKTREALGRMRQIHEAMQGALGNLQQGVDRQRTAEDEALEKLVGELRRGISRAQQGEGRLRDDLRQSSEEQARATAEHLRNAKGSLIPSVLDLLQDVRELLRPQKLQTPEMHGNRALAGTRAALSTALSALEQSQYDVALQALIEAEDLLGSARRSLAEDPGDGDEKAVLADQGRLGQAAEKVAKAAMRLREALPSPATLLKPPTRSHLEQGSVAQEQLRRALDKLRQKLAQAQAHPALQRQVGDRLDHALQTMRDTMESLQHYDARRAFDQTAEVMDALERAAGLLENQGGGQASSQPRGDTVGMDGGQETVELHEGNQSDAVETFRQEVLKAMQQKQPGTYQDRLQRYYRAIAR